MLRAVQPDNIEFGHLQNIFNDIWKCLGFGLLFTHLFAHIWAFEQIAIIVGSDVCLCGDNWL